MGWCAVVTAEQLIHELGRETWPRVVELRMGVYDALYAWLRFARDETHAWSPPMAAADAPDV